MDQEWIDNLAASIWSLLEKIADNSESIEIDDNTPDEEIKAIITKAIADEITRAVGEL